MAVENLRSAELHWQSNLLLLLLSLSNPFSLFFAHRTLSRSSLSLYIRPRLALSFSLSLYIYMCVCIYIYIYISFSLLPACLPATRCPFHSLDTKLSLLVASVADQCAALPVTIPIYLRTRAQHTKREREGEKGRERERGRETVRWWPLVRSGNGENAAYPFVLSRFGRFVGPAIYGWILPASTLSRSLPTRIRTYASLSLLSSLVSATISAWRDYLFHWVSVTLYGSSRVLPLSLSLSFSPPFSVSSPKGDESSDGGSVVSSNKHRAVVYNGLESLVKWNSRSFHRTKFHLTWISSEPCEGSDGKAKKEFRSP